MAMLFNQPAFFVDKTQPTIIWVGIGVRDKKWNLLPAEQEMIQTCNSISHETLHIVLNSIGEHQASDAIDKPTFRYFGYSHQTQVTGLCHVEDY